MIPTSGTIIGEKEKQRVLEAVKFLSNPEKFNYHIREFEERFAEYVGTKYAVAVTNGTSALHLSLLALGIGKGDEVILPNLGFVSAAFAVSYTGATPVFVDVNSATWTISPTEIVVTKKTKAIMPVYMYGNMPEIGRLKVLGVPIIEDACPAIGVKGVATTEVSCFSFQGAKTLAIGEGGMLVTNNKKIYDRARKLSNLGKVNADFHYDEIGYNYRMSNIQAALGLAQLEHINELLEKKRKINQWYGEWCDQQFESVGVPWINSMTAFKRKELRDKLASEGVETRPVFPMTSSYPMYKNVETPASEFIARCGINLPSATYLTKKDIDYVKSCLKTYYK